MDGLIVFLLIGLVAGWLGSKAIGKDSGGLIANLVIGVIGAIVGGYLLARLGVTAPGLPPLLFRLIAAVLGSIVLLLALRLVRK